MSQEESSADVMNPDASTNSTQPFNRGHVVWIERAQNSSSRPYLILSDEHHPHHGEFYIGIPLTMKQTEQAIEILSDDWIVGGTEKQSYILPWEVSTFSHQKIRQGLGAISEEEVNKISQAVSTYILPHDQA